MSPAKMGTKMLERMALTLVTRSQPSGKKMEAAWAMMLVTRNAMKASIAGQRPPAS